MSLKNKSAYDLLGMIKNKASLKKALKKVILVFAVVTIVCLVGSTAFVFYAINRISTMASAKPDVDLIALEQLIKQKTVVLTQDQKTRIVPVIKELSTKNLSPEQVKILKTQLFDTLDPTQVKRIEELKSNLQKNTDGLTQLGINSATETFSKYTGIPTAELQRTFDGISAWLKLGTDQKGTAEQLLQEMNNN